MASNEAHSDLDVLLHVFFPGYDSIKRSHDRGFRLTDYYGLIICLKGHQPTILLSFSNENSFNVILCLCVAKKSQRS